jgi:hypothetical protein
MCAFTKTLIVDVNGGGDYLTIKEAAYDLYSQGNGGVIIVESGNYYIDGTGDKTTIYIPSNNTSSVKRFF